MEHNERHLGNSMELLTTAAADIVADGTFTVEGLAERNAMSTRIFEFSNLPPGGPEGDRDVPEGATTSS